MPYPFNPLRRRLLTSLLTVPPALAIGGCGRDAATPEGPVTVKIGETAGIPTAFLQFGVAKGFFRDTGIRLKVQPIQGAAPIVTGLVAGDFDMGGSDVVTWVTAREKKLPLTLIAPGTAATHDPERDFSAVLAPKDSGITKPQDLAGRKIAVNILKNIGTVTVRGALDKAGVDSKTVEFTEVGFPDMVAALERGSVDAAWIIEPFSSIGQARGHRPVLWPYAQFQPGLQIGTVVTTEQYVSQHRQTVTAFQKAHARTARHIAEHPDEFRTALVKLAKFEAPIAEEIVLPTWREHIDRPSIDTIAKGMRQYGLIRDVPELADHIADGA